MTADAVGGIWQYALTLMHQLSGRGVQFLLATMGPGLSRAQWRQVAAVPDVRVAEGGWKLEWMHAPWSDLRRAGDWLLALRDGFKPHLVHLNHYVHAALPWRTPVIVVGHSCVVSWWHSVHQENAPEWLRDYQQAVQNGLHAATAVVAPSGFMLESLDRWYRPVKDSRVIHNGADPAAFSLAPKCSAVLNAGRLGDEGKNVRALLRAAPAVSWPIHLAGDLAGRQDLLPHGVHYHGKVESQRLRRLYARASMYASPALYEPFGLSVLEAASSGCALVLADIPTFRELWNGAALFFPPRDTRALADGLNAVGGDPARRAALQQAAAQRAERYSAASMGDAYLRLYHSLI